MNGTDVQLRSALGAQRSVFPPAAGTADREEHGECIEHWPAKQVQVERWPVEHWPVEHWPVKHWVAEL